MLKQILIFLNLIVYVFSKDVCYESLGCFTDSSPFSGTLQRPFALLPETPQKVGVKFNLYTRELSNDGEQINYLFLGDNFDSNLPIKFIIHGFIQNAKKQWIIDLKNAILKAEKVNVITVDWGRGSGFPYTQATANTQIVGAEIARLIGTLNAKKSINPSNIHLIGHSLGAHIAGYAGERVPGIGRITGLDPAGPYFENTDPRVRLDPTDAKFVEVIHTDGAANLLIGLGLIQPIGHVDFYPNGGKDQPDCPATPDKLLNGIFNIAALDLSGIEDTVGCSHIAAINYYTDSINNQNCKYTAYPCNSKSDFDKGNCLTCSSKGCNRMGYWSTPNKDLGNLYLNTQSPLKNNCCKQNFMIRLVSSSKQETNLVQARGKFSIYLKTLNETSAIELLDDSETTFKPDSIEVRLISINEPLVSQLENVFISYKKTSNFLSSWLYDNEWSFKYIEVLNGQSQLLSKFCPNSITIQTEQTVKFFKC